MSAQVHTLHLIRADAVPAARSRIKINEWAGVVRYVGSMEDLIAAGYAADEMFPKLPKRVKAHIGRDIPRADQYKIKRLKGGKFEILRWPDGQENDRMPARWNPDKFKNELAHRAWFLLNNIIIEEANGAREIKAHGQATHQLNQRDIAKLENLVQEITNAIFQSKVENVRGLRVVK